MNFKDYIQGKRHGKEANRLEREAMNDPFLQDAIDGYDSLQGDHLPALEKLEQRFATQPKRIDKRVWLGVAAAVLVLLIAIPFLLRQPDMKDVQVVLSESPVLTPEKDSVLIADHTQPEPKEERRAAPSVARPVVERIVEETSPVVSRQSFAAEEIAEITDREIPAPEQPERAVTPIEAKQASVARLADSETKVVQKETVAVTTASNTKIVSGKIVDEIGEPIIGATVSIKNSPLGTVTDMDGNFRLTVPEGEKGMLVASFVGMKNVEMPLKEELGDVVMKSDDMVLNETIVVGYGTAKKKWTGSASKRKTVLPVFGEAEFRQYFEENYDKTVCVDKPVSIRVEFYVNAQGQPGNITIKENSCQALESEIKRLLLGSPKWSQTNRKVTLSWTLNE